MCWGSLFGRGRVGISIMVKWLNHRTMPSGGNEHGIIPGLSVNEPEMENPIKRVLLFYCLFIFFSVKCWNSIFAPVGHLKKHCCSYSEFLKNIWDTKCCIELRELHWVAESCIGCDTRCGVGLVWKCKNRVAGPNLWKSKELLLKTPRDVGIVRHVIIVVVCL